MSWQDLPPEQSQLAFQVKVAQTEQEIPNQEIPEPSLAGAKISNSKGDRVAPLLLTPGLLLR